MRPSWFRFWLRQSQGQDLIEYALLAAFVGLAVFGGANLLGGSLDGWYSALGDVADKGGCSAMGIAHSLGKCVSGGRGGGP